MKTSFRCVRFALVGALGMAVQLGSLALLNRWMAGRYLWASAVAIELAVLHNFVWHLHYTWRDRRVEAARLRQLLRFHLSNGLVSLIGNLVLMRLLVQEGRLPLLLANIIAIACCSIVNFTLGDLWAFPQRVAAKPRLPRPMFLTLLFFSAWSSLSRKSEAQTQPEERQENASSPRPSTPASPKAHVSQVRPNDSYFWRTGYICGIGASTSSVASIPATGCGVGFTFIPLPIFTEIGVLAPQANRSYLSGYVSVDGSIPLAHSTVPYLPMAIVGYSRLFETGHALDYGFALAMPRHRQQKRSSSLRLELRDYWTFANPTQHNIMLRIGWMGVETD